MARGRPRTFDEEAALEAALRVFWQHGYEGTSIATLTDAMAINAPSLYAAFGNKEALFQRVVQRYMERPASYLRKALEAPTAREAATRIYRGAIEMVLEPGNASGCLFVQGALATGPQATKIAEQLSARRAGAQAAVQRRFERAVAEGDATMPQAADPAALAMYVVTVLWGMSVQAAGGATRAQLEAVAEHAMRAWPV